MLSRSTASTSSFGSAFTSFRSPGYPMLWWAGLFSFMSVQMQFLLRGLLAWDLTEREGALGLTYLFFGLSMLIATPLGGVASDRLPKRTVLVASQGVILAAATGMGLAVITGTVEFWMLLVSAVAQGCAFGFFGPARVAISSEIVGRQQLGNAITLSLLSMNGTRVFAPALAGTLAGVAFIGIGGAYLLSAACSLASFIFLVRLPGAASREEALIASGEAPPVRQRRPWWAPFADIIEGLRYVMARPSLRRLVLTSFVVIMFGFNYISFLPALVKGEYGLDDAWVGYISSASALGAMAVALPLAARADSAWARAAMTVAGLCFGLGVAAIGVAPGFWVAFGVIAVVGAATTTYQSLSNTLALTEADPAHQGRVQSLMQLSFAGFGIAALPLGGLAEVIGLKPTIVIMGAVAVLAVVVFGAFEGGWARLRPAAAEQPRPASGEGFAATVDNDVDLARAPAARS